MAELRPGVTSTRPIIGAILAGGLARRMGGGDKCLLPVGGRPILSHVVERLAPQCAGLVLSANGDPTRFSKFGLLVLADGVPDFAGPLAGLLAVLDHVAASYGPDPSPEGEGESAPADRGGDVHTSTPPRLEASLRLGPPLQGRDREHREDRRPTHLLTVPGDTPFLPRDLVERLVTARDAEDAILACAASGVRTHPVVGLWPLSIRDDLRRALAEGERAIGRFARRYPLATVEWKGDPDPFLNVNSPSDLAVADAGTARS